MKTNHFISTVALSGLLLTASAVCVVAQVNDAPEKTITQSPTGKFLVVQTKPMQFKVLFNTPQNPKIAVRILDSENTVLYKETKAVQTAYLRYFDLSPLHDGTYTFEIVDGNEKYNQSFDVVTQTRRIVSAFN
ncbi:hypothetical protein [Salmonirosea aquatica]|uniref:Secretion system C-terminal sorting domain-containing protein n=1 Tax=Salmonirosea aquatica TaxID=2654236 RepID=A0A7C9FP37_9BACT|nr:hypothetical protein [Cytophagaceae bacterium SJW1-29]